MVMSEGDFLTDPVVLWLNGGPGCSSFDGFIYEHGPFLFNYTDGSFSSVKLTRNPYSWSQAATMIYLDSPAGVGLSYSQEEGDFRTNDTATAADADAVLRELFRRYEHLAGNDFYIAGESYAGIYVPMLTKAVVDGNAAGKQPKINIKGYLVGNGCTDEAFDGNAQPPFAVGKSLIPTSLYEHLERACGGSFWDAPPGSECSTLLADMWGDLASLNIYGVLEECHHKPKPRPTAGAGVGAGVDVDAEAYRQRLAGVLRSTRHWPVSGAVAPGARVLNWAQLLGHNPPCTDATEAELWLNDPQVRDAIRAAPTASAAGNWTICSDRLHYHHDAGSMIPIHAELINVHGLRALIYSGDHDLAVPHTGSEAWTRSLNLPVITPWRPWHVHSSDGERQVAGYQVHYDAVPGAQHGRQGGGGQQGAGADGVAGPRGGEPRGSLVYATVKGAGHMVPESKPLEALALFSRFIRGQALYSAPAPGAGRAW